MTMEPQPIGEDVMGVLRDVVEQLEHDFPVRVQSFFRSPPWTRFGAIPICYTMPIVDLYVPYRFCDHSVIRGY